MAALSPKRGDIRRGAGWIAIDLTGELVNVTEPAKRCKAGAFRTLQACKAFVVIGSLWLQRDAHI